LGTHLNSRNYNIDQKKIIILFDTERAALRINVKEVDEIQIELRPIVEKLIEEFRSNPGHGAIPADRMIIEKISPKIKARFYMSTISGRRSSDTFNINQIQMDLLIGMNQ